MPTPWDGACTCMRSDPESPSWFRSGRDTWPRVKNDWQHKTSMCWRRKLWFSHWRKRRFGRQNGFYGLPIDVWAHWTLTAVLTHPTSPAPPLGSIWKRPMLMVTEDVAPSSSSSAARTTAGDMARSSKTKTLQLLLQHRCSTTRPSSQ